MFIFLVEARVLSFKRGTVIGFGNSLVNCSLCLSLSLSFFSLCYVFFFGALIIQSCLDIKFRHPKIKSIDDLKVKDCPTLKIDTVNLDRAYDEGVSANEKLRNYETLMDLKNNLINTTTISSLARHIIAAKNQDAIIDLHHQQQPYEEASRIIVKK